MQVKKTVLVPVADGAEEIETITIVDVLRRAEISVTLASIMSIRPEHGNSAYVQGSRGIGILCDGYFKDYATTDYDMIVLPGGLENAKRLSECEELIKKIKAQKTANKYYAAICASPALVFEPHGLLDGESGTCYPTLADKLKNHKSIEERVVVSGKCITSRGPGTAMEFSIKLVEMLIDSSKAMQLAKLMLAYIPKQNEDLIS